MASGEKEIAYGATYKTYTDSGASHFKTYVDALRELIDNSVQYALEGNTAPDEQPEIQLLFCLKGRPEAHTVVVGDNGRGMNEMYLTKFLSYMLTHEARGIEAESGFQTTHKDNAIGKYGIGAKEAMFYLGDGVEVITKYQGDPTVRNISMSKASYEKRFADGVPQDQVLKDTMRFNPWVYGEPIIDPAKLPTSVRECTPIQNLLCRYECDQHYNVMILPRFEHSSRLTGKQEVDRLAEALANTYAFALCPEMYDQLFSHTMSKVQSQSHTAAKGCKITLTFESDNYSDTIALHELVEKGGCYMGRFLLQSSFPEYVKCFEGTYKQRQPETLAVRELGESSVEALDIKGVLTYFPFDSDQETKPVWEDDGTDGDDASKTNPILVFWKNRLVPHDLLKDLFFLEPKSHRDASIQEFRHRCCGILFFPGDMNISRNKMNLITDKNSLYDALLPWTDGSANSGNCVWKRDLTSTALSWLKKMHNMHDKEIEFSGPVAVSAEAQERERERVSRWVFACCESSQRDKLGLQPTFTGFEKASFSSESKLVVKVGDRVRVRSAQVVFGVVQEIVAQGRQSDGYRGQGWFLLKRFPEEIYREEPKGYPMSKLSQKGSGNGKVSDDDWNGEMEKQSAHLPARLQLYHWAKPDKRTGSVSFSKPGSPYKVPSSPIELQVGDAEAFRRHLDFSVQIFGAGRKASPMSSIKETKLKVICRITAEPTEETTEQGVDALPNVQNPRDYVCDAPTKESNHQYFFGSNKESYEHRASAFIKDWTTAGVYSVTFVVTDSSRQNQKVYQVEAPTVKFKVCSGPVCGVFLESSSTCAPWASKKKQLQLGKKNTDPIHILLQDANGNSVAIPPDLPAIECVVHAQPAHKGKTGKESQREPDEPSQTENSDNLFEIFCTAERHPDDDYILVLKDVKLDCKGKLHPAHPKFKRRRARKVLGDARSDNRHWRKVSITVSLQFDHEWIECDERLTVVVLPGIPDQMEIRELQEADVICVTNGDALPSFAVQLTDHVGIDTYPAQRDDHTCQVSATQDVFAEDANLEATFTAKGTAEFKRIVTHVTDRQLFNQCIDLELTCKGSGFAGSEASSMVGKGLLSIKVTPSDRPSRIEVWRSNDDDCAGAIGGADGLEDFTEEVGVEMTDLKLVLFDESDNVLKLPSATIVYPSWYTSKKKPCTSSKLPTLKLPNKPGEEEYSVRIKLAAQGKTKTSPIDDYRFKVTVVPGCPSHWKLELKETEIRCGAEKDLNSALSVYATDQYGNRARADTEADSTIEPILGVKGATLIASVPKRKTTEELSLRPQSRRLSGANDENGYTLVPIYNVGPKARLDGVVCQCELTVSDVAGRFHACDGKVNLVPGEPAQIALESNILDDAGHEDQQTEAESAQYFAHVPANYKLEDLVAKLVDTGGNFVSDVDEKFTLRATADSDVKLPKACVTRAKKGVARFSTIALSAGKSAESYTLQVDCRPSGVSQSLSTQLVCKVALSNAVIEMKPTLTVRTAICGKPLDARLKIDLLTEDGKLFVPSAGSFDCIIKRKQESQARLSQQQKTATPVFELFDGGASVKDGAWMLDDVGGDARPFVPEQTGVYQITCTYRESRAGMRADMPLKALKLDVPIQAGPAVKLVCSNNRVSVNANNGHAPNGRKLMKFKIKCEDKYGNSAEFPDGCSIRAMLASEDGADQALWPALEDSEDSGVHNGAVVRLAANMDTGKYQRVGLVSFDLSLKEGIGEKEGVYSLKFELVSNIPDQTSADDVEPVDVRVNFTPDGIRSKEIEDKQAQLDDLIAERTALKERFDRAETTYRDLRTDMKEKVKRAKDLLKQLAEAGAEWAQKDLEACSNTSSSSVKNVLSSEICEKIAEHATEHAADLEQDRPRRAKVRPRKRMDAIKTLGRPLVELGFVDDADLAHTLSWAAGVPVMDSFVAPDSKRQRELYSVHRCNAFSEDQLDTYQHRGEYRNADDKKRGSLPLELPLSHRAGNWPHTRPEPVFLVNLIELPANQEHYRDTIFWRVFRSGILVGTLDEAMEYRRECKRHRKSIGSIYTRDGHVSSAGGFLQAGTGRPALDDLPNVFGALGKKGKSSEELSGLQEIASGLYDDHSRLESVRKNRDSATAEYGDHHASLENKIDQLQDEIQELKRSRKRGSAGDANGPAQRPRVGD